MVLSLFCLLCVGVPATLGGGHSSVREVEDHWSRWPIVIDYSVPNFRVLISPNATRRDKTNMETYEITRTWGLILLLLTKRALLLIRGGAGAGLISVRVC